MADRGTVRPPPGTVGGCTVARLAVRLAVHGWPFQLHGWPCGRPCTVGRHGWPADHVPGRARLAGRPCSWPYTVGRVPGRARLADPVGRPTVFRPCTVGRPGWPVLCARLAGPVGRPTVFLAVHGWPTRLAGRPCSWPCTVGRPGWPAGRVPGRARLADPVGRPTVFLAVHGWLARLIGSRLGW